MMLMVCAALVLTTISANAQTRSELKAIKKEERKALREERKHYAKSEGRTNLDNRRILKENYKQRKKIDRAARKQNKGYKYDGNALGNVFDGM
jgi:hypothetical protein